MNDRADKACRRCSTLLPPSAKAAGQAPSATTAGRPLERRQLTIMFTDLVNSAALSDSMDPEDFRALIEAHRTAAVQPIKRYDGVVARYLGDGMLIYFGYPEAHEDDPDRAVRAGLEIVDATRAMNERWVGEGRGRIAVRIGIHTGIVVVGDVLKQDVQEPMAVFGNAPTLSSRLQALAEPNSVILSQATKALLRPTVRCVPRGQTTLKGMAEPVEIFMARAADGRVIGDRISDGSRKVLPFVNREKELSALRLGWASAKKGVGKAFLLAGDPGIGKSRLIRALEERVVAKSFRWLVARTSPYATNSDFFAFSELFHGLLQPTCPENTPAGGHALLIEVLGEQGIADPHHALGFANLLGVDLPDDASPHGLQPERLRDLTLGAIAGWFEQQAADRALVLVIEDLHWADASTLEAIHLLLKMLPSNRILMVMSSREPAVLGDIEDQLETLPIERLPPDYARTLIDHVIHDADLPKAAVDTLLERADGVPLFLEELPKPVLESGRPAGLARGGDPVILPATLRDSLMAQLDRIGAGKAVAQTGAVLGHSFEATLMRRVFSGGFRQMEEGLDALTDAGLLTRHGAPPDVTYAFKHALLAEIAYDSLLRQECRQIHRRTADALVAHFSTLTETRPELVARHYAAARDAIIAFDYWMKAGKAAARRSANTEAIGHLRSAEAELERLKASGVKDLDEQWLALYLAQSPVLSTLIGWSAPEVEEKYLATLKIFDALGIRGRPRLDTWKGLYNVHFLRGDIEKAREITTYFRELALELQETDLEFSWHGATGSCSFLAGNFREAVSHIDYALSLVEQIPEKTDHWTNPSVIVGSLKAWSHWFVGDFRQANNSSLTAIDAAKRSDNPFDLCYAYCLASSLAQCRGDFLDAESKANIALEISIERTFPYWQAWALVVKGWALSALGNPDVGLELANEGIARYGATGAAQMQSYNLCLLTEAYQYARRWEKAADAAEAAIRETLRTGVIFYQAEAYRLYGEAMHEQGRNDVQTIQPILKALKIADKLDAYPQKINAAFSLIRRANRPMTRTVAVNHAHQALRKMMIRGKEDGDDEPKELIRFKKLISEFEEKSHKNRKHYTIV